MVHLVLRFVNQHGTYIDTNKDTQLVLGACFQATFHCYSRRSHSGEHNGLIISSSVFDYECIGRWTDGIT